MENKIILITGGARSGKSSYGLKLGSPFFKKAYVATAQPLDEEMQLRIEKHQRERGASFATFESPLELPQMLESILPKFDFVLVDCLTFWIANLLLSGQSAIAIDEAVKKLLEILASRRSAVVLVTNEVGMGVVPDNELGRKFRDLQGKLNQLAAARADEVIFMVAGLPVFVKKEAHSYAAV